jgi:hypothetical protein
MSRESAVEFELTDATTRCRVNKKILTVVLTVTGI